MTEQKLNQLFESARNAQIETSQEEVTRWLTTAAVAAVSAGAAATGFKLLLTKNALAMVIGTLSVAGIAIVSTAVFSGTDPEVTPEKEYTVTYTAGDKNKEQSETTFFAKTIVSEELFTGAEKEEQVVGENELVYTEPSYTTVVNSAPLANPWRGMIEVQNRDKINERKDTLVTVASSREIMVDPFTELVIDGVFDVIIEQGEHESVFVDADEQGSVEAINDGKTLILTSTNVRGNSHCKDVNTIVVHVTVKNLNRLEVHGIGNVRVEGLNMTRLAVEFDGVGDLTMDMITCGNFQLIASGVGNVYLSGDAGIASFDYDGVGDIRAYEFRVHEMHARSTGVGNMYLYADESITIDADGIGDIRYQGDPNLKELNFSGIGTLKSENEKEENEEEE